ncbi:unnamed protein product [Cyclocybe aegerita]|uniref:Uncharacterized protein n=1 Tax=Cyclocybe aegerita TaxID=1973307 RepID=A0A8S0WJQ8_CYCAE|nr:unnamed protein product [Cyclocybe aegerita]
MTSSAGHPEYDANLLAQTPAATKAQLQGGYNADLLNEKTTPSPSPPSRRTTGDVEAARPTPAAAPPSPPKAPFYRTRKGIITIVVALIVVIAAVVGGAVGGTRNRSSSTLASDQTGAPVPTDSFTTQDGAPSATSSLNNTQITISQTQSPTADNTSTTVFFPFPTSETQGGGIFTSTFVGTPTFTIGDPSSADGSTTFSTPDVPITLPTFSPPTSEAVGPGR